MKQVLEAVVCGAVKLHFVVLFYGVPIYISEGRLNIRKISVYVTSS